MNDYFEKIESAKTDLTWNIPETKQGSVNVFGGNSQSFKTSIKISEFLAGHYPIETVNTVLPDALKSKLPPLENFLFLPSTDSGSFADDPALETTLNSADFTLALGDFSKNSITKKAVTNALAKIEKPALLTRDTIDLIVSENPEKLLMNENIIFFASLAQLQSLLRAVYYPKMLMLSSSLVQVSEILHKFTLSYPTKLITFHSEHLLLAENGNVKAVPLNKTGYAPITLWSGDLAAKLAVLNLYNPNNFLSASISALFS